MSRYYAIRVIDGRHVVGVTTDGRDFVPIPTGAFGKPRDAIRYAELRQRDTSPLRGPEEEPGVPPCPALPPGRSPGPTSETPAASS